MKPCPRCGTDIDREPHRARWINGETICGDCAAQLKEILEMTKTKNQRKGQRYYMVDGQGFAEMTKEQVEHMARTGETMPLIYFGRLTGPIEIAVESVQPKVSITVPSLKRDKAE